jgi:hypothetical protein
MKWLASICLQEFHLPVFPVVAKHKKALEVVTAQVVVLTVNT